MRMRRFISTLVLALLVAPTSIAIAAPAAGEAMIQDVDLSNFPQVKLEVIVPGSMLKGGDKPVFTVHENDRPVDVLLASVKASDQPIDAVLVVDASGSMKGASMDAAKAAALAFIAELRPPSKAALVAFSDKARVVMPMSSDAGMLRSAVNRIEAGGETALYDAVLVAIRQVSRGGSTQPVVIVLSDGGDTMSRTPLTQALGEIRKSGIPVLAVALPSSESDSGALRMMARQNGGRVATVKNLSNLTAYYEDLAQELQTRYRVVYNSRRPTTMNLDIAVDAKTSAGAAGATLVVDNPLAAPEGPTPTTVDPVPPANLFTYGFAVVAVFVSVGMLVAALALLLSRPKTGLDQLGYYDQSTGASPDDMAVRPDRVMSGVFGAIDSVAGKGGFKLLAYEELDRAGLPLRPTEYMLLHLSLVVVSGLIAGMFAGSLSASLIVVAIATVAPILWISYRIRKRRAAFDEQLPDMLDLLAGSLRAGWGLQQALDVIIDQTKPPMSDEFRRAQTETRLGRSVEQSLESVAERVQSMDFSWVVSAISIQREVGGNLAELLTIVASTIRERNAVRRQISALTSEGRLSAVILFVLPFLEALILYITNPGYMSKLLTTSLGNMLLATGLILLLIGAVWLNKVTKVEV